LPFYISAYITLNELLAVVFFLDNYVKAFNISKTGFLLATAEYASRVLAIA